MNDNARAWVAALRSGDYIQTTGRLRRPGKFFWSRDRYCAAGVLYRLHLEARNMPWPADARQSHLPEEVLRWAGVSRELEQTVVALNDTGRSFRELASIIEARFHREERRRLQEESARIAAGAIGKAQKAARRQPASADPV